MAESTDAALDRLTSREYEYGFVTDIEQESIPPGLDEGVVRLISEKKNEPEWLLAWPQFTQNCVRGLKIQKWKT